MVNFIKPDVKLLPVDQFHKFLNDMKFKPSNEKDIVTLDGILKDKASGHISLIRLVNEVRKIAPSFGMQS